jgi:hypothetical protein
MLSHLIHQHGGPWSGPEPTFLLVGALRDERERSRNIGQLVVEKQPVAIERVGDIDACDLDAFGERFNRLRFGSIERAHKASKVWLDAKALASLLADTAACSSIFFMRSNIPSSSG